MRETAKNFDLAAAVLHGPAYWGWQPASSRGEALTYRCAFGGFTFGGLVEALLLNAANLARIVLFFGLAASVAAWITLGQTEIAPLPPSVRMLIRVVAGISMLGTFGALAGDAFVLRVWPLAVALGVEFQITLRSIGVQATGVSLYRSALFSVVHLAVAMALILVAFTSFSPVEFDEALTIYVGMHLQLMIIMITVEVTRRLGNAASEDLEAAALRGRAAGLGARTAWLHDTAISDLKGLLKSSKKHDPEFLVNSIARIEDDLRDEYLELQMAEANEVDLGAVMYRYARKFRSDSRSIDLPGLDVSQIMVDGVTGQRIKGFLDVTVQNAVDAGASRVAITIEPTADCFEVSVEDNAGGFDHRLASAGGSLTRLQRDSLGGVNMASTDEGSRLSTRIERGATQ